MDLVALGIVLAAAVLVVSIVVAILKVVWVATGNLFDWVVQTFGNEDAVEEVRRRRK